MTTDPHDTLRRIELTVLATDQARIERQLRTWRIAQGASGPAERRRFVELCRCRRTLMAAMAAARKIEVGLLTSGKGRDVVEPTPGSYRYGRAYRGDGQWHGDYAVNDGQGDDATILATVWGEVVTPIQAEANARLFAAGPGLLAACRYCLDMLEQTSGKSTVEDRIGAVGGHHAASLLRDAIAKTQPPEPETVHE